MSTQKLSKRQRLDRARVEHEAWLKKMGVGRVELPRDKKGKRLGIYDIPNYKPDARVTSDQIPGNGSAKDQPRYTGTEIMGVTLNHKSNYEPVRKDNKQAAKESARMRRG